MNRRDFFKYSLPAFGAVMLAPGLFNSKAFSEINRQFTGEINFQEYDLIINGAGLSGYFAAIHAAQKGLKVLIVDKRTSPGFDIAAKRKLWLGSEGFTNWDAGLTNLFFPTGETQEIFKKGGSGPNESLFGDELLLFAGSVKKGLTRNLLVHKVDVLLMTEVCGLLTDDKSVHGVLLATKHGLYSVKCKNFIDASDNLIFSRELLKQKYKIKTAGFVLELLRVDNPEKKTIEVSKDFGIENNEVHFHLGKNADNQMFVEFKFPVKSQELEEIEMQARHIAAKLGEKLPLLDERLKESHVHYYALESSLELENNSFKKSHLAGHSVLETMHNELTCQNILAIKSASERLIDSDIITATKNTKPTNILLIGGKVPIDNFDFAPHNEPGFVSPLMQCKSAIASHIPNKEIKTGVLVAGGGTAGAVAAIGALEKGADSIVLDYFNDLGGTKTMGGVMPYYLGRNETPFIKQLEYESNMLAKELHFSRKIGRKAFLADRVRKLNGRFIPSAIICDAIVENKKVKGVVICHNGRLTKVMGDLVIDATGDGDIAYFAGATYSHGNSVNGETQNYSQWNLTGGGEPPSFPTSDYDIVNNTKISELQRGLFLSHYEGFFYDFHPYLTVRESRRIKGLYELDLIDAAEATHFEDMIGLASSDFDPHNVGHSELSRCGFLLPHSNIVQVEIPYRSIVPEGLDGLLIAGKAISQTHNALQFTRMSADIMLLGYVTGQIAAHIVIENIIAKDYNVATLQKEWFQRGFFPAEYANKKAGNDINNDAEIERRVNQLAEGKEEYLYECIKLPKQKAIPKLKSTIQNTNELNNKLKLSKALAWFGEISGCAFIEDELIEMFDKELRQGYPEGYIENYDFIRGREKNVLEGLYWRINQNIGLLAMSGDRVSKRTILHILENTTSGGDVINWTGERADFFNSRIDLKIIPFYNRILNLCFYAQRNPDEKFNKGLEKLLKDENIGGFITEEYHLTRWRVYSGNLELHIGATLARCGSKKGYEILLGYFDDIHYNFKNFALNELKEITSVDYGYDKKAWKEYIASLSFPQDTKALKKEIEW